MIQLLTSPAFTSFALAHCLLMGATMGIGLQPMMRSEPAIARVQAPSKITFARSYKVGDSDSYHFKLSSGTTSPMSIEATFVDKVDKVYPDGNADITESTLSLTLTQNGSVNSNTPKPAPFPFKVTKYGILLGTAPNTPAGWVIFTLALPGENHGLAVGDSFNFKRKLSSAAGSEVPPSVSGKVTLVSLKDGIAKLKVESLLQPPTVSMKGTAITGTVTWDQTAGKYVSANLNVLSPGPAGTQAIHLVVNRVQ